MPKKVNEKAEAARDRKEQSKAEQQQKASKAAEDTFWKDAGEGETSKAAKKREELERQRLESQKKREEAKKLALEEEASISHVKQKAPKVATGKVTQHQINTQREFDEQLRAEEARLREMNANREVAEEQYTAVVLAENTNRQDALVEARNVDEALAALTVGEASTAADKHPERRMKSAWIAFEERELKVLKEEKPGLKQSQYRDMLWKLWQKSPENPMNQAAVAGGPGRK